MHKIKKEHFAIPWHLFCETTWWNTVRGLTDICFSHGGYIAGGFASELFRISLNESRSDLIHNLSERVCEGQTDIDIFFCEKKQLASAIKQIKETYFVDRFVETPRTCILNVGKVKFQLIKIRTGIPESVIKDVDIVNTMVAIDKNKITYDKMVPSLFENDEVKIAKFHAKTVERTFKYKEKKNYNLSEDTQDLIKLRARFLAKQIFGKLPAPQNKSTLQEIKDRVPDNLLRGYVKRSAFLKEYDSTYQRIDLKLCDVFSDSNPTITALSELLQTGNAFISGGFSHDVAACIYRNKNFVELSEKYQVNRPEKYDSFIDRRTQRRDFDVYFINPWALQEGTAFLKRRLANSDLIVTRTPNSLEFDTGREVIQVVTCVFGTPTKVMETFDFTNCMTALYGDELIIERRVPLLLQKKILEAGTHHAPSPYHMSKYLKEKGYTQFGDRLIGLINEGKLMEDSLPFFNITDWYAIRSAIQNSR